MLVVGLTGGIGSGKSTVANLFAERGVPIIDADVIAKEITLPGNVAYQAIIDYFGKNILSDDGLIDRTHLRAIIFEEPNKRIWLEKLLHPIILETIKQRIRSLDVPYCITVIPLLLEFAPHPFINRILVIDTTEQTQINRVLARDHSNQIQVEAMLQAQTTRALRLTGADDIITNDGSLEDLIPQVDKLHKLYSSISDS